MSDNLTSLGMTDEEYRENNEVLPLGTILADVKERRESMQSVDVELGCMSVDGNILTADGHEWRYTDLLPNYLNLPTKYFAELPTELRNSNLSYWLGQMSDKVLRITFDGTDIIDIDDPTRPLITIEDLLLTAEKRMMPLASVYHVYTDGGGTWVDITNRSLVEYSFGGKWQGGIRVVQKRNRGTVYAPRLFPYLRSIESSAYITFPEVERITMRGLSTDEVLDQFDRKIDETLGMLAEGEHPFKEVWDKTAQHPARIAERVLKEHKLHNKAFVTLRQMTDDLSLTRRLTSGDMVRILASHTAEGHFNEATKRVLAASAGSYFLGEAEQHRCPTCLQRLDV